MEGTIARDFNYSCRSLLDLLAVNKGAARRMVIRGIEHVLSAVPLSGGGGGGGGGLWTWKPLYHAVAVRGTVDVETAVPLSGREGDCGRGNRCTTQ